MMIGSRKTLMHLVLVTAAAVSVGAMAQSFEASPLMIAASGTAAGASNANGTDAAHTNGSNSSNTNATGTNGINANGTNATGTNGSNIQTTNPALRRGTGGTTTQPSVPSDPLQQQRQQSGERMIMERKGQVQDAN